MGSPQLDDPRYTGRYGIRPSTMGAGYEVYDQLLSIQSFRASDLAEAQQLADQLNQDTLMADPPIWFVVIRGVGRGRVVNAELLGWERRHGGIWHGLVQTSQAGHPLWYPAAELRDPTEGVFAAPRSWPSSEAVQAALRLEG